MARFVTKNPRQLNNSRVRRNFNTNSTSTTNETVIDVLDKALKTIQETEITKVEEQEIVKENKEEKNVIDMNTQEKIAMASELLADTPMKAKRIRKDKGLIERTESSTIVLTEDNRELLKD